jgi:riboflavin kinase / FMN adenylyltransferase
VLTIQFTENFRIEWPAIVTIGTFDGVHLGHQKILKRLFELKQETGLKTVVLTFEPHPRKVLFPDQKNLRLITTINEKLELFEKYGVDVAVVYPFTSEFSKLESELYVRQILIKQLNVNYLVIGYDHRFGKDRQGDIHTLKEFAAAEDFLIEEISAKDIDNIAVSSSKIRKALEEGDLDLATNYLGHRFFLSGLVIKGKQLGKTIGFPTANIKPEAEEKIIPRTGVYFVSVELNGLKFYGMTNIGYNPTTDLDRQIKIEVNIFDFDQDIYGVTLKIILLKRLRDEEKFENLEMLTQQLYLDRNNCFELINQPV